MGKRILITDPAHDDITRYLGKHGDAISELAENKGHSVNHMKLREVRREEVEKVMLKRNPDMIIFHGHGGTDRICGDGKEEILIKKDVNDHLLKDKIVHSITCSSASELGKSSVEKGCLAYIGFDDEFFCPYLPEFMAHPEKDFVAQCNLDPVMQLSTGLIKGNSVKEAYARSQASFRKWLGLTAK